MTRNRAERRHPMMRLKKLIVALMIDVMLGCVGIALMVPAYGIRAKARYAN